MATRCGDISAPWVAMRLRIPVRSVSATMRAAKALADRRPRVDLPDDAAEVGCAGDAQPGDATLTRDLADAPAYDTGTDSFQAPFS